MQYGWPNLIDAMWYVYEHIYNYGCFINVYAFYDVYGCKYNMDDLISINAMWYVYGRILYDSVMHMWWFMFIMICMSDECNGNNLIWQLQCDMQMYWCDRMFRLHVWVMTWCYVFNVICRCNLMLM